MGHLPLPISALAPRSLCRCQVLQTCWKSQLCHQESKWCEQEACTTILPLQLEPQLPAEMCKWYRGVGRVMGGHGAGVPAREDREGQAPEREFTQ